MPALDSLLFSLAVLSSTAGGADAGGEGSPVRYATTQLKGQWHTYNRSMVQANRDPMPDPKISPNNKWTFTHLTVGYGRLRPEDPFVHRFRVFSPDAQTQASLGDPTTRALLRLWDIMVNRAWRDHSREILGGAVDVYLAKGGAAGGEQRMSSDRQSTLGMDPFTTSSDGKPQRVNVIYLYQVDQQMPAIERLRETAHEYGHASLPNIGDFTAPESWANGDFGERLFLHWVRENLTKGLIKSEDVLGATLADLDAYVAREYTPRVKKGAFDAPSERILKTKSEEAYWHWVSMALWIEAILPPRVFSRALEMGATQEPDPFGFPKGVVEGVADFERVELTLPDWAVGQKVWIPLGKGAIQGGKVLNRQLTGWAQVITSSKIIVLTYPKAKPSGSAS
jgi:hypothetical protein